MLAQRIAATAPKIAAVLQAAHQKNASAKIFLIGYPDILPPTTGCWPSLPILPADIPYLYNVEIELNTMLANVAAANGATFVDLYPGTEAHNACSSDLDREGHPRFVGGTGSPERQRHDRRGQHHRPLRQGPHVDPATGLNRPPSADR